MRPSRAGAVLLALAPWFVLAACASDAPPAEAEETAVPAELESAPAPPLVLEGAAGATPMAQRVARLGLINKRNTLSRDIELRPGESRRLGNVIVRLAACERTAPWEDPAETGAFVQVLINQRADADSAPVWQKVFSGWLFRNNPGINVVEHPIYDVWVKDCAMSFPGEETAP